MDISVVTGNNQSDTAGRVLPNTLVISVTSAGQPLASRLIKILQPHCSYVDSVFLVTDSSGQAHYSWQLDGKIGSQELIIYALDSTNHIVDSAIANANGLFFDHTWMPSTCLPKNNDGGLCFAELSNGRILLGNFKLFYSDDSGKSWAVIPSFSASFITSIAVYGNNVFVTILGNQQPLYRSTDNGLTWQPLVQTASFGSMVSVWATNDGKIFLNALDELYLSIDTGQTWKNLSAEPNGTGYASYYSYFCESADGTIYAVNNGGELWVSNDGGNTWIKSLFNGVQTVFSDVNKQIYVSTAVSQGQIFKLVPAGSGNTWNLLCSFPVKEATAPDIINLMELNNVFYFTLRGYGLMKTSDFVNFKEVISAEIGASLITGKGVAIIATPNAGFPVLYNTGP